ncbi:unnamed protein product [Fraxinus pennsylvanica]|uniref:Uncharacterized protein n=1 Tax=Fraxinus pennsylvanica TaxID=56036 RepID=A0AAD1YSJ3_9LAMI|nr:unnamed protein product [Fraxinus pennsylvanica]
MEDYNNSAVESLVSDKYFKELEVAVKAVQMACLLCQRIQQTLLSKANDHVQSKDDNSPVTIADCCHRNRLLQMGRLLPTAVRDLEQRHSCVFSSGSDGEVEIRGGRVESVWNREERTDDSEEDCCCGPMRKVVLPIASILLNMIYN